MKYVSKKCPHCGKSISFEASNSERYGSPFKTCPNCLSTYIDRSYKEIAISGYQGHLTRTVDPISIIALIVGIAIILAGIIQGLSVTDLSWYFGLILFGVGFWLTISNIKDKDKRREKLEEMRKASEERLSNIEYARALQQLGYAVPAKYLNSQFKEDN